MEEYLKESPLQLKQKYKIIYMHEIMQKNIKKNHVQMHKESFTKETTTTYYIGTNMTLK